MCGVTIVMIVIMIVLTAHSGTGHTDNIQRLYIKNKDVFETGDQRV